MRIDHLKLSHINLYAACSGAANMIAKAPQREQTDAQQEGILAHQTLYDLSRGFEAPIKASMDMINHAYNYLASLENLLTDKNVLVQFEAPVFVYMSHNSTIKGFADFLAYDEKNKSVIVHDYKYGHTPIDIETDLQTVIYASAAYPMAQSATVSIEQPRSFGEKRSIKIYDNSAYRNIQIHARGVLFNAAQEDAKLTPGSHCAKCPARVNCPSINYNALNLAEASLKYPVKNESTSDDMSKELSFLTRVKSLVDTRIKALEEEITYKLTHGGRVPGYTLKSVSSRLEWTATKEKIIELAHKYEIDLLKPQELVTPLQAVKKGLPEKVMQEHTIRQHGALRLYELTQHEIAKKLKSVTTN